MSRVQWVSVEGNIGAGKSTLIRSLTSLNGTSPVIVNEPVEKWMEKGIFQLANSNPREWNFAAQCHYFSTRVDGFCEAFDPKKYLYVSERSPFTDTLFWDAQVQLNRVDPLQHEIYHSMWSKWQRLMPAEAPNPTLFVYLRPSLEHCMMRTRERSRPGEQVDEEYSRTLYENHDKIFTEQGVTLPNGTVVPCIIVNGNDNFRDDLRASQTIKSQIESAMN